MFSYANFRCYFPLFDGKYEKSKFTYADWMLISSDLNITRKWDRAQIKVFSSSLKWATYEVSRIIR